jgi:hypothetical protein
MRIEIEGACHCGKISYVAAVDPDRVVICHCTDCQTISGAPYRVNVLVMVDEIMLHGDPKLYMKRGDSGAEVATRATKHWLDGGSSQPAGLGPEVVWRLIGAVGPLVCLHQIVAKPKLRAEPDEARIAHHGAVEAGAE